MLTRHSIGDAIRERRKAIGLSQRQLAASVGVHAITVSNWERGENVPDERQMTRLADVFATSPGALRYGSSDPDPEERRRVPRAMREMSDLLERDLLRAQATDDEIEYVRAVLLLPETLRLLAGGAELGTTLTAAQEDTFKLQLASLRAFVLELIARRTVLIEPIKPKDLPAEMEKRRAELEAERRDSKPSRRTK